LCRSASSLLAVIALAVPASAAQVQLQTAGAVESGPPRVQVRVDLANLGDAAARGVTIEAELLGQRQLSRLEEELPAQSAGSATFAFDVGALPPGVYPLALHVQYARSATAGDVASQRGYLLLALGANPRPPVVLTVAEVSLDTLAPVAVRVESADVRPHRVRLRMLAPRGLQAYGPDPEVKVPQFGSVTAELRLLRGGAPRPSRQGLVVLAETIGEEPANASAATAVVDVQADPAWMPRLRAPLIGLAVLLLAAAVYAEKRRRDRRGRAEGAEDAEGRRAGT
jgi:hypothetical protein